MMSKDYSRRKPVRVRFRAYQPRHATDILAGFALVAATALAPTEAFTQQPRTTLREPPAATTKSPALAKSTTRPGSNAAKPTATYWVYVGAESADQLHRIKFGPQGAVVEKTIPVGEIPTENEGPHGLQISRDGKYLHMTTGHGNPDGKYWKFELGPDTLVGQPLSLGNFPASIDVTPDGMYAFAVNFNLYGEMIPSSVSVIYTPSNTEVARTTTCAMPHGSRVGPRGTHQYSTCMMDDQLVELDTRSFEVARRFGVAKGKEGPITAGEGEHAIHGKAAAQQAAQSGAQPAAPASAHGGRAMPAASCSPTWAQPSVSGDRIFVACNKSDQILEIDREGWQIVRRLPTGRGPYNLAVTPDGKLLIATLKQGAAVQVFELATGKSVMQEKNSTTVAHGIVVSPDSRYAFVSSEGVGAAPGKVDIYDLRAFARVGTVDVGQQAGGIAFWKMEPAAR